MPDDEIPLEGGNLNHGIVRVGDTVRRAAGPWTPGVHALLGHLTEVGYPAPRPIGVDEQGREVLSFIPGVAAHPDHLDVLATREGVHRAGRLVDDYHRAQESFVAPRGSAWQDNGRDPSGSGEVLAHNDLSPWNLVVGRRWVFIDWDLVAPGRRNWDLAWALHSLVGLWPESTHGHTETCARITAFCDGARVEHRDRGRLLDAVVERTAHNASEIRRRASSGDPAYCRMLELGHAERWESGTRHVQSHLERWSRLIDRDVTGTPGISGGSRRGGPRR
jgi:hypothetical protein